MQFRLSPRSATISALLAASCVAAAVPAFADPGYTHDNKPSLVLHNDSGCKVTAEFFRGNAREFVATLDNGGQVRVLNVGQYRLAGAATCGKKTVNVITRTANLSKQSPQTMTLRSNAAGEVFYQ